MKLLAKIKLRIRHNKCFAAREKVGLAAFGMCSGHYHNGDVPYDGCSICPYFVKRSADDAKE